MRRLIIDPQARVGEIAVVNWSVQEFGHRSAERYAKLIRAAYADLTAAPERSGAVAFEGGVFLYHIRHSQTRAGPGARVRRPRHLVVYRFDADSLFVIGLLHDSMDIPARLREVVER